MNTEAVPYISDDADRLLSESEFLARLGGLGRTKAWEMRRDGEIRFVRISPRKIGYPVSELRRLIAERTLSNRPRI